MGTPRTAGQAPLAVAIAGACTLALAWRYVPWPYLLGAGALLAAAGTWPLASRRFGWRRRPGGRRPVADSRIQLSSRKSVVAAGDRMLKACRSGQRPLCVAVVEVNDLPEVQTLFGHEVAGQITRRMAVRLQAIADRGLAERTSATQFTVLLPGMEAAAASRALQAVFGDGGCVEYEGEGDELVLLPEFRVAEVPEHHSSILKTYVSVCPGVARAAATAGAPAGGAYVATVPVPL